MRFLVGNEKIENPDITKITIRQPSYFAENFIAYPPASSVDTASSLKYLAGAYLHLRRTGVDWYENFDEIMADNSFKDIVNKIEIIKDDELQSLFDEKGIVKGKVSIETSHGIFEKEMKLEELKGNPRNNPMSLHDIQEKFIELAIPIIGEKKALSFLELLDKNDLSMPVTQLVKLLV